MTGRIAPVLSFSVGLALLLQSGCALSPPLRAHVESDLALARSIHGKGASPLHRQIFGDQALDGASYLKFFEKRVKSVQGEGILAASCDGAIACNTGGQKVRISTQYIEAKAPSVIRLSLLLHEARHSEGWSHVKCPSPLLDTQGKELATPYGHAPLSGKSACDDTSDGAYGIQYVMLKNIERYCDGCSIELKRDAGNFAEFILLLIQSKQERAKLLRDNPS